MPFTLKRLEQLMLDIVFIDFPRLWNMKLVLISAFQCCSDDMPKYPVVRLLLRT
jgi:hypothetical protein